MKRNILLLVFLVVSVAIAIAQNNDNKWGIGLGAGVYENRDIKAYGFMPQLTLNRYVSPSFDMNFQIESGLFNEKIISDLDLANFSLNLKYKLSNSYIFKENSLFQPYIYAGPSYLFDNRTEGIDFHGGAGTKIRLSQKFALFLETAYIDGLKVETPVGNVKDSHVKATAGLIFSFGKAKDTDFDGVPDKRDNCPDTPSGIKVDEHGCPLDTDGDGIADYIDDCPDLAGLVDLNGCPDKDGDGIADKDDKCPDVYGLAKFAGCPDSDNDNVPDNMDKCPDTPAHWKVDKNGCPLDSDKDGIVDEEDKCPDVPGTIENQGCPPEKSTPEAIEKFTTILFDTDKSKLLPNEQNKLGELTNALKTNPEYKFHIYGHADKRASDEYNQKLSEKRANAVATYFKNNGIEPGRILEIKGYGETRPAVPNTSPENMQKNRRVELLFEKNN